MKLLLAAVIAVLAYLVASRVRVTGEPDPYAEPWFA